MKITPRPAGYPIPPKQELPAIIVNTTDLPEAKKWELEKEYKGTVTFRVKGIESSDGENPEQQVNQNNRELTLDIADITVKEPETDGERSDSAANYFKGKSNE